MIQVIRHGKGPMGRVVQQGQPIKYANNLIVTPPLAPARAAEVEPWMLETRPAPTKKKGKRK